MNLKYEDRIIPLLRRMINLEELMLFLSILRVNSTYIDGIQLYDDILIYMPLLKKFSFSINTGVLCKNMKINLASNEDIQRSFNRKEYEQVGSYVKIIETDVESSCHIYSLPYHFQSFGDLDNSFQGGVFCNVRCLVLKDSHPFEHNFFKVISESFPYLKELYILNNEPQKDKQLSTTTIIYPHLILLDIVSAHVDYAEQFFFEEKTHLPRLLNLYIRYESLAIVTNNFTSDATRLTCSKVTCLTIKEPFVRPANFQRYFPLL
jgi:hypothetical protein